MFCGTPKNTKKSCLVAWRAFLSCLVLWSFLCPKVCFLCLVLWKMDFAFSKSAIFGKFGHPKWWFLGGPKMTKKWDTRQNLRIRGFASVFWTKKRQKWSKKFKNVSKKVSTKLRIIFRFSPKIANFDFFKMEVLHGPLKMTFWSKLGWGGYPPYTSIFDKRGGW